MDDTLTRAPSADPTINAPALTRSRGKRTTPLLVAIVASAGAIRFAGLGAQSFWYDEYATTKAISGGITGLWHRLGTTEGTPPLYYAVATLWVRLFGSGDTALRSLSAVAGTATVFVVACIVQELGCRRRIALIAATLTAVNPFLVWYSQEARAYALAVLLGAVSFYFFARAHRRGGVVDFVLFGAISALLLTTQYFAIFFIAPQVAVLVVRHLRAWKPILVALLFIVCAGGGVYPLAAQQRKTGFQGWIIGWPLHFRLTEAARHAVVGIGVSNPLMWWSGALAILVAVAGLVLGADRHERRTAATMFFIGAATVLLPVVFETRYVLDRNLIVALIPLIIVVSIGLGARGASWPAAAATSCIVVVSLVSIIGVRTTPHDARTNWRSLAETITKVPGDHVVVINTGALMAQALQRYLPHAQLLIGSESVSVRELDFVERHGEPDRCDVFYGQSCFMYSVPNSPTMRYWATFEFTERAHSADHILDRYRSTRVRPVQASELIDTSIYPDAAVLFVPAA